MKTIVLTGAAQGIGKSVVELLLENKESKLIVIDKQTTEFISNCEMSHPDRFKFYLQDVAEREQLSKILSDISDEKIDGIVNNAGEVYLEKWEQLKLTTWDRTLAVNLTAPLQIVHELSSALSKGSSIVNIASVDGYYAAFDTIAYAASKAGLINVTKSLAASLGPRGIRANAVAPGWVETEMTKDTMPEESIEITPLKRNAQAIEIAKVVKFLLSDQSSFINGETITVDGGLTVVDYTLFKESS